MSDVRLESAGLGDAAELLPLIAELNALEGIDTPPAQVMQALERLLGDAALGRVFFIHSGAERAGYLIVTYGYDLEYGGRDAWLTDLYLRPAFQGRGLGTAALARLDPTLRSLDVQALHLMVHPSNRRAAHVYEKSGFAPNPRLAMLKLLPPIRAD